MQQAISRGSVGALGRGPVRPRSNLAAISTAVLKYPSPGTLVLLFSLLEAFILTRVVARQSVRRLEIAAILERAGISLQYTSTRLLGQDQTIPDVFLETGVWNSHVLRPSHYHTGTRLIHVVLHSKVSCYAMHQHAIVRGHVWKFVANFLLVLGELYQIFLDFQQDRAILLIAIYGLRDEMLQIYAGAVRVQLCAAICEGKDSFRLKSVAQRTDTEYRTTEGV